MTIIATHPTELGDHIYRKGERAEYDGPITPRIAANFTDADGNALGGQETEGDAARVDALSPRDNGVETEKAIVDKTIAVMKRQGIIRALDALGVAYSAKNNTEKLARTLLVARGEID